jgi:hypothetical protein
MKKVLVYAALVFMMASCSKAPDNIIHDQKTELTGKWVYDSRFSKPVQEQLDYVSLSPTWGQSFYYANKRADRPVYLIIGIFLLLAAGALLYGVITDARWVPDFFFIKSSYLNITLFVLLAFGSAAILGHPSGIKWNNDKWVERFEYDKAIKESESTQPIWDSLETHCLIVDGPYNCYTK